MQLKYFQALWLYRINCGIYMCNTTFKSKKETIVFFISFLWLRILSIWHHKKWIFKRFMSWILNAYFHLMIQKRIRDVLLFTIYNLNAHFHLLPWLVYLDRSTVPPRTKMKGHGSRWGSPRWGTRSQWLSPSHVTTNLGLSETIPACRHDISLGRRHYYIYQHICCC